MRFDFEIDCKIATDESEYICDLYAKSSLAQKEFGKKSLATINFEKDEDTLNLLHKKYGINPSKTIILNIVQKHANIGNIANMLICSLIQKFNPKIKYIYLYALNDKLVKFYTKLGFETIEGYSMIGKISNLTKHCISIVPIR